VVASAVDRAGIADARLPCHSHVFIVAEVAAGGDGILIGDGRLNYRPEKIFEAYYAYSLNRWSVLTFDYQFIADPAYNADRGPVSFYSLRFHAEF
jgi:high affinity Mn2+ porin